MCQSCQDTSPTPPLSLSIYIYIIQDYHYSRHPSPLVPTTWGEVFFLVLEFIFIFIFFGDGGGTCAWDDDEVDLVVFGSYWAH